MKHLLTLLDLTKDEVYHLLNFTKRIKAAPQNYYEALKAKTLLMIFQKPSLRTKLSFEIAMNQLGGHAIFMQQNYPPQGRYEIPSDQTQVFTRYVDIITARVYEHKQLTDMKKYATVPIINALSDYTHPCQILADIVTIQEHLGGIEGKTIAYLGDGRNNTLNSWFFAATHVPFTLKVAAPEKDGFNVDPEVVKLIKGKANFEITTNPEKAVEKADIVYTDTWMSYHISKEEERIRLEALAPYQVTKDLMSKTNNAKFMHCLPAYRGEEVTAEVIDNPNSIIFDEAENRLHIQKSILLFLLGKL